MNQHVRRMDSISQRLNGVIHSTNPLRIGEPNVLFGAESNTWGRPGEAPDSAQKVWQHLAMSTDRIQVLVEALDPAYERNDFANRTVASYVVLELHAAFKMTRASRAKKLKADADRPQVLREIEAEIDALFTKKSPFGMLRDKIIAHLDGDLAITETRELWQHITWARVTEWVQLLLRYVGALGLLFPEEHTTHFKMRNVLMPTIAPSRSAPRPEDYTPFNVPGETGAQGGKP